MNSNLGLPPVEEKHGETDGDDDKASTPEGRKSDSHLAAAAKGGKVSRSGRTSTTQPTPTAEKKAGVRDKSREHSNSRVSTVSTAAAQAAGQAAAVTTLAETTDNKWVTLTFELLTHSIIHYLGRSNQGRFDMQ